jgi:hypothetical protein
MTPSPQSTHQLVAPPPLHPRLLSISALCIRFFLRWLPVLSPPSNKPEAARRAAKGRRDPSSGAPPDPGTATTSSLRLTTPFLDVCLGAVTLKCTSVGLEVGGGGVGPTTLRIALSFDSGTLFVRGGGITYAIASVGAPGQGVKTTTGMCGLSREGEGKVYTGFAFSREQDLMRSWGWRWRWR